MGLYDETEAGLDASSGGLGLKLAKDRPARPLIIADARFRLAGALLDTPQQPTRAAQLVEQARQAYQKAGASRADELAEFEAWLSRRGTAHAQLKPGGGPN